MSTTRLRAWQTRDTSLPPSCSSSPPPPSPSGRTRRIAVLWDISYLLDTAYRITLHQTPLQRPALRPRAPHILLQAAIIKLAGRVYYPHVLYAALAGATATLLTWRILVRVLEDRLNNAWATATLLAAPLTVLGIYSIYPHPVYDSDCILSVLACALPPPARSRQPTPQRHRRSSLHFLALLQAKHRPALSLQHPRDRHHHRLSSAACNASPSSRNSGFSPEQQSLSPQTPDHPAHRRSAQLHLLDHHLRRAAPPARPQPHPRHLPTDLAPLDHPRCDRCPHPSPSRSALDTNGSHSAPRSTLPLDHRLYYRFPTTPPTAPTSSSPSGRISSSSRTALALYNLRPQNLRANPDPQHLPPANPSRDHPRYLPLAATVGIHLCPLAAPHHPLAFLLLQIPTIARPLTADHRHHLPSLRRPLRRQP